jgi:hypothetical protein
MSRKKEAPLMLQSREIGEKRLENRAGSQIIARRRSHPGSSDSDQCPQLAENKGVQEY